MQAIHPLLRGVAIPEGRLTLGRLTLGLQLDLGTSLFVPTLHFSIFTFFCLSSSSVSLTSFIIVVPMHKCTEEPSCTSSTSSIYSHILNGTCLFRSPGIDALVGECYYTKYNNNNNNNNNLSQVSAYSQKMCQCEWQSIIRDLQLDSKNFDKLRNELKSQIKFDFRTAKGRTAIIIRRI